MPKTADIELAIKAGVNYIAAQQLPGGGFKSFSSPSAKPFEPESEYLTTFTSSLILAALAEIDVPESRVVCERLAGFLRGQASPEWSFNYWAKRTPQRRSQPYPDDLDDTFCALAALHLHDPLLINAAVLAKVIKILLATEMSVGGPYRTWLVPTASEAVWLDVDLAVNSNVAYCLTLLGSPLPKLSSFIDDAILSGNLRSPYYPSDHMTAYYMARGYNGQHKDMLIKIIRALLLSSDTGLERALCVSSLLRLDPASRVGNAVAKLVKTQNFDGAWPAAAFCLDPAIDGQPYYNGAPALTTAFATEALQLYLQNTSGLRPAGSSNPKISQDLHEAVLTLAKKQCQNLSQDLRPATLQALRRIADSSNGREIIGLAYNFNQSLAKSLKAPANFIETLGLANLYGWLAYTIYDDFIDGEGQPELISVANAAMRRSLDNFEASPSDLDFSRLVRQTFDTIDGANAWELAHCRFESVGDQLTVGEMPNYGNLAKLAERSLGHGLPLMAVLAAIGIGADKPPGKHLVQALRHYLIARQLNDDAHDWPDDLRNGHITPVVAMLLTELKIKPGNHSLPKLLTDARSQFWHSTLPAVCQLMRRHVRLSRQALRRSGLLKPDNVISGLLDNLEASIADTLHQQSQAEVFLKHYKRKRMVRA